MSDMRPENIDQVLLLCTGNLEFSPCRKHGHFDHDCGIRAEAFEITDGSGFGLTWEMSGGLICE